MAYVSAKVGPLTSAPDADMMSFQQKRTRIPMSRHLLTMASTSYNVSSGANAHFTDDWPLNTCSGTAGECMSTRVAFVKPQRYGCNAQAAIAASVDMACATTPLGCMSPHVAACLFHACEIADKGTDECRSSQAADVLTLKTCSKEERCIAGGSTTSAPSTAASESAAMCE